jgi:hypothetical protein
VAALVIVIGFAQVAQATGGGSSQNNKKITICHKTNSSTNPWNVISINKSALMGHLLHGDLIWSQAGGCAKATFNPIHIESSNADPTLATIGYTVTLSFTASEKITTPLVVMRGLPILSLLPPTRAATHGWRRLW